MPEGKATTDQSRLGLVLAKEPPTERVMSVPLNNTRFAGTITGAHARVSPDPSGPTIT